MHFNAWLQKGMILLFLFPILKYKNGPASEPISSISDMNSSDSFLSFNLRQHLQLRLLMLAAVFCFSCWTTCDVFGTFTHPLCLFYLKMWQMMTMTSLIRTGFSGLSLRNTSRKEGGGGERAAGWKLGRFWVGTDTEEFVPDAADSVKAV